MPTRKNTTTKARSKSPRTRATRARPNGAVRSGGVPATVRRDDTEVAVLRGLPRSVRSRLAELEREVERAQVHYRRAVAALLREASRQLGDLEARGEKGWAKLDAEARERIHDVLQRLDEAVAPRPSRAVASARRTVRRTVREAQRIVRRVAAAVEP